MAANPEIPKTFEVPDTDFSGQFLDTLLGRGWDTFGRGNFGGGSASELMLQIFAAFNVVAMSMVMVLFVWTCAITVVGTAHEGVPFGKKYSSVWMPIRFACSIGALAPIFKGLSFFQIAILAVLGWSINLGNYVWSLGTNYFLEQGGQITVQAPSYPTQNFTAISNGVLKSLVLQNYLTNRRHLDIPGRPGRWSYSENWIGSAGKATLDFAGDLGQIVVECTDQGDAMCSAKMNAVNTAVSSLQPVAEALANPDTDGSAIDQTALYNAAQAVQETLLSGLRAKASEGNSQLNSKLRAFQQTSEQFGWFAAGASYWSISWINSETRASMYGGLIPFLNQI
jgi:conjugal transfer/type IV secretion protein DotA/TraY